MRTSTITEARRPARTDRWSLAPHRPVSRHGRGVLIAVATAGGERVDRNFEDAESFLLYEKTARRTSYIGRQPCHLSTSAADTKRRTSLLADCDLVLCANISDGSKQTLCALGIDCNLAYAGAAVSDAVSDL